MRGGTDPGRLPGMKGVQLLGGRYALLDQVGTGGMAEVWRARDEVLGRTVAVKLLAGKHAGEPEARDRIRAEARAAAALSHPNIAQVYDYGEAHEYGAALPYVVMELIRGGTLQDRMDAGPLSPRFAMRVAAEVAAALAAAHADGLVHRDIKPANVMVTETGAKVVDFGIAAAINPGGTGEEDFEVLGTPAYLAPERLIGDGPVHLLVIATPSVIDQVVAAAVERERRVQLPFEAADVQLLKKELQAPGRPTSI